MSTSIIHWMLYLHILTSYIACALVINNNQNSGDALNKYQAWSQNANTKNSKQEVIIQEDPILNNDRDSRFCHLAVKMFPNSLPSSNSANVACRSGRLLLNHAKASGARRVQPGDIMTLIQDTSGDRRTNVPSDPKRKEKFIYARIRLLGTLSEEGPSHSPLRVLYEDNVMAIVCKPAGIHTMSWSGTFGKSLCLDEILPLLLQPPRIMNNFDGKKSMTKELERMEDDEPLAAPLPRHRLDRRVAGPVVIAKTRRASVEIGRSFEEKTVVKEYRAIVVGKVQSPPQTEERTSSSTPSFTIVSHVDGRPSETKVVVLGQTPCPVNGILTDLKLFPKTGRRHQLRIHCADVLGTPILGDDLYWNYNHNTTTMSMSKDGLEENTSKLSNGECDPIPNVSVRKRQGLYLYCKKFAIHHPIMDGKVVCAEIEEPFRFTRTRQKAWKGFQWAEENARSVE